MTNLDQLDLTVKTNGVMSPEDVLRFSGDMLTSYFGLFNEEGLQIEGEFIGNIKEIIEKRETRSKIRTEKETYTPIEIMGLSSYTQCAIHGDIPSIEQLTRCTEAKLSIKGFGKESHMTVFEILFENEDSNSFETINSRNQPRLLINKLFIIMRHRVRKNHFKKKITDHRN